MLVQIAIKTVNAMVVVATNNMSTKIHGQQVVIYKNGTMRSSTILSDVVEELYTKIEELEKRIRDLEFENIVLKEGSNENK